MPQEIVRERLRGRIRTLRVAIADFRLIFLCCLAGDYYFIAASLGESGYG